MIRIVLFDIDGTLIRTGGAGVTAFAETAAEEFGKPEGTRTMSFHGRTDSGLIREFLESHGLPVNAGTTNRFLAGYLQRLENRLRQSAGVVLPGVHDWLQTLASLENPPHLGLLTGNVRRGAELKLGAHKLWEHFQFGAYGDDHADRNEIARIAQNRAASILGRPVMGREILVLGDTHLDIACARAIGARCLAVATGGSSTDELARHHPDWLAPDLTGVRPEDVLF